MSDPFFAPEEFVGERFLLRTYRCGDGKALSEAASSSYEHLRPWMPWAVPEQSITVSETLCRRFCANYLTNVDFVIGIWDGETLVGGTGFHLKGGSIEGGTVEIGMWIRHSYAGQGAGTIALQHMLEWGFTEWGWQRLVWRCDTRNKGSARVAEKCGLVLEGTMRSDALDNDGKRRSTHIYAILREDWEASRK